MPHVNNQIPYHIRLPDVLHANVANTWKIVCYCLLLCCIFSFFFLSAEREPFESRVVDSWDWYEYQTMAVNFARNGAINMGGLVFPYEEYKLGPEFSKNPNAERALRKKINSSPGIIEKRAPVFPVIIGLIYRFFGEVNPALIRYLFFASKPVLAGFLPLLAYWYWGRRGLITGSIAGAIYLAFIFEHPRNNGFDSEQFTLIWIHLFLLFIEFWKQKQTMLRTAVLGFMGGFSVLVKYILVFLPVFSLGIFLRHSDQEPNRRKCYLFLLSLMIPIVAWSAYRMHSGIGDANFLRSSASELMDQTVTERFIKKPQAEKRGSDSIYFRDDMLSRPLITRWFAHFSQSAIRLPSDLKDKWRTSFSFEGEIFIIIFLMGYIAESVLALRKKWRAYRIPLCFGCAFFSILTTLNGYPISQVLCYVSFVLLLVRQMTAGSPESIFPLPLFALFFNYLIIVHVLYGIPRFFLPLLPLFIVLSVHYVEHFLRMMLSPFLKYFRQTIFRSNRLGKLP